MSHGQRTYALGPRRAPHHCVSAPARSSAASRSPSSGLAIAPVADRRTASLPSTAVTDPRRNSSVLHRCQRHRRLRQDEHPPRSAQVAHACVTAARVSTHPLSKPVVPSPSLQYEPRSQGHPAPGGYTCNGSRISVISVAASRRSPARARTTPRDRRQ